MGIKAWLVGVLVLGGCGDERLTIEVRGDAYSVIVAQDGDGPWQQVELINTVGSFEATAGYFGVAQLCRPFTTGGSTTVFEPVVIFSTEAREERFDLRCSWGATTFVTVTGSAPAGTRIFSANSPYDDVVADSGTYGIGISVGVHDIFAVLPGAPDRFLAKRGLDIRDDLVLDLPVDVEGVAMTAMTPTVTGGGSDVMVYADLNSDTDGGYVYFGEDPTTVSVPPTTALAASDHAAIGARSGGCTRQVSLTDETPVLAIPRPLTGGVGVATGAIWDADPAVEWDEAGYGVYTSLDSPTPFLERKSATFFATDEWLAITGADRIPYVDLAALPGAPDNIIPFATGEALDYWVERSRGRYDGDYTECSAIGSLTW